MASSILLDATARCKAVACAWPTLTSTACAGLCRNTILAPMGWQWVAWVVLVLVLVLVCVGEGWYVLVRVGKELVRNWQMGLVVGW